MRYTHPDYDLVIEASGGYAVLERLGWKTDLQREYEEKKEIKKEKGNEFFNSQKKKKEEHKKYLAKVKAEAKNELSKDN